MQSPHSSAANIDTGNPNKPNNELPPSWNPFQSVDILINLKLPSLVQLRSAKTLSMNLIWRFRCVKNYLQDSIQLTLPSPSIYLFNGKFVTDLNFVYYSGSTISFHQTPLYQCLHNQKMDFFWITHSLAKHSNGYLHASLI